MRRSFKQNPSQDFSKFRRIKKVKKGARNDPDANKRENV